MLNKMLEKPVRGAWLKGVLAACLLAGSGAAMAATVAVSLCATSGAPAAANGLTGVATVYGYTTDCTVAATKPGGPVITATVGDTVVVTLSSTLAQTTGLLFQGQALVPDTTGIAAAATKVYSFTPTEPGTYLYEAAPLPNAEHQVAMGLYGALVVRPTTAGQAYNVAASAYNDEAVLVLSEIDPALNNSAAPASFDMRNFAPKFFLINGKPYPATDAITGTAGNKLLLRYVNAGAKHHSMSVLGLRQLFVAKDAGLLTSLNYNVAAETLAPGQTGDAIVTVPTTAAATAKFAVYDASLSLHNSDAPGFGGMLAFVNASGAPAPTGPTTSGVTVAPNPANGSANVALSASLNSVSSTVSAAEYLIDTTVGTGTAMTATFGSATVSASATLSVAQLAALSSGKHTVYVRGQDALGNWGTFSSAVLNLDKTGPATTGLTLTPNPSNGTVSVALHATGNDSASGGSNVTAAEYFLGATGANGTGIPIAVNVAAPVASLDATIAPPVSAGVVSVHARDALGNWGPFTTITLSVVGTGPTTTATAAPPANNGTFGLNSSSPVVRVTAVVSSTGSTAAAAEGFIDAVATPAAGSGFPFVASDGAWNSASETATADIPLANINALPSGMHTLSVRGRDAAGNWGALYTFNYLIDRTMPTLTGVTAAPATTTYGASVVLTVSATDPTAAGGASGVAGGEYWFGTTAPAAGSGTPFTGATPTVSLGTQAPGVRTIGVRVRDAAGNWSATTSTATVTVVPVAADDAKAITANTSQSQQTNYTANGFINNGVLANDTPGAGRAVRLASAPVRTGGTGAGTIAVTCQGGFGNTAATPAIGGNTLCTNGAFRVTLTAPAAANTNALRQAAKRGTYTFTYVETVNGQTSAPATVTITVN